MRSSGQVGSALTGVIAATTSGVLWTFRYPEAATKFMQIRRLHQQWTTLTAFGTLVTAGRGLRLVVYSNDAAATANPSSGNAWTPEVNHPDYAETLGVGRVASTGALTLTGYTARAVRRRLMLSHAGASGANYDEVWNFEEAGRLYLKPGWLVAIATDAAFDATGTGQLKVDLEGREVEPSEVYFP